MMVPCEDRRAISKKRIEHPQSDTPRRIAGAFANSVFSEPVHAGDLELVAYGVTGAA